MPAAARPLRRDAERNRARVLAAARELISEHGLGVGHELIARSAGVGMGTVYRRFPERQDLIDALFAEHIDEVVAHAEAARRATDPWAGIVGFMETTLAAQAEDRGLRELLRAPDETSHLVRDARRLITPVVADLIARAQVAGQLPADISPGDLVLVELMVTGVMDAALDVDTGLWRRALAVALEGLRSGGPLPGAAPGDAAIDGLKGARLDAG